MLERTRPTHEDTQPAAPPAHAARAARMAMVSHWPHCESLPVASMTVAQIRQRYADRFDIDPDAEAIVNGNPADDEVVIEPGQMLMFVRRSGEKGTVLIEKRTAEAIRPEGKRAIGLDHLLSQLAPPRVDTGDLVLPDGVKAVRSRGAVLVFVLQLAPAMYNFKWIANDSRVKFGHGTRYRTVRLALPYVVVLATFAPGASGRLELSSRNECFFVNRSLASLDDRLYFPALLNVSKMPDQANNALAWICTEHLDFAGLAQHQELNARIRTSLRDLTTCLLGDAFNLSSEHHEGASHWGESRGSDPRLATVEAWEKASAADPLFVLDVQWVDARHTVREAVERIFRGFETPDHRIACAEDIERIIFNAA